MAQTSSLYRGRNSNGQFISERVKTTPLVSVEQALSKAIVPKMQKGGIIKDNRGQWAHPGKPTQIQGEDITMKGVPYPVKAVTDKGQTVVMQPGQEYKFPGAKHVNEYPMKRHGGSFSMGSSMTPSTGETQYRFNYHFPGPSARMSRYKNQGLNSMNNLGDYNTQLLMNKMKTFQQGGSMSATANRRNLLKKGIDVKLYPFPFKRGGKMATNYHMNDNIPPKSYQAGGQIKQDNTSVSIVRPIKSSTKKISPNQWNDLARQAAKQKIDWFKKRGVDISKDHNVVGPTIDPGYDIMGKYQTGGRMRTQQPNVPLNAPMINMAPGQQRVGSDSLVVRRGDTYANANPMVNDMLTKGGFNSINIGNTLGESGNTMNDQILSGTRSVPTRYTQPKAGFTYASYVNQTPPARNKIAMKEKGGVVWGTNDHKLQSALKMAMGGKMKNKAC